MNDLRGADDPPLVLAPVHTQYFVAVSLQSSPRLHDKLAQAFHLLSHLMHWTHMKSEHHLISLPPPPISILSNLIMSCDNCSDHFFITLPLRHIWTRGALVWPSCETAEQVTL